MSLTSFTSFPFTTTPLIFLPLLHIDIHSSARGLPLTFFFRFVVVVVEANCHLSCSLMESYWFVISNSQSITMSAYSDSHFSELNFTGHCVTSWSVLPDSSAFFHIQEMWKYSEILWKLFCAMMILPRSFSSIQILA